jgi:hypothetical protein
MLPSIHVVEFAFCVVNTHLGSDRTSVVSSWHLVRKWLYNVPAFGRELFELICRHKLQSNAVAESCQGRRLFDCCKIRTASSAK